MEQQCKCLACVLRAVLGQHTEAHSKRQILAAAEGVTDLDGNVIDVKVSSTIVRGEEVRAIGIYHDKELVLGFKGAEARKLVDVFNAFDTGKRTAITGD